MQKTILPLLLLLASTQLLGQGVADYEGYFASYNVMLIDYQGFSAPVVNRSTNNVWDFSRTSRREMDTLGLQTTYPFTMPNLGISTRYCVQQYPDQYYVTNGNNTNRSVSARAFVNTNGTVDVYTVFGATTPNFGLESTYNLPRGDSATHNYMLRHTVTGDTLYGTTTIWNRATGSLTTPFYSHSSVAMFEFFTSFRRSPTGPAIRTQKEMVFCLLTNGWAVMRSREDRDGQGNITKQMSDAHYNNFYPALSTGTPPWYSSIPTGSFSNGPFYGVAWPTPNVVYLNAEINGLTSNLKRSNDAGRTWADVNSSFAPTGISAISNDTLLGVFQNQVHKSTDGGQTWSMLNYSTNPNSPTTNVRFVHAFSSNSYIAFGNGLDIRRTIDGGQTWQRVSIGSLAFGPFEDYMPYTFEVVGDNIWFGTNYGRVFRTANRGASWAANTLPGGSTWEVKNIAFRDANNGIAIDGGNGLAKTTDGGLSWSTLPNIFIPNYNVSAGNRNGLEYIKGTGGRTGFYMLGSGIPSRSVTLLSFDDGQTWLTYYDFVRHSGFASYDAEHILNYYVFVNVSQERFQEASRFDNCDNQKPVIWKNGCRLGCAFATHLFFLPNPKWYKDGVEIPNAQGLSYPITQSGSYQVAYIDPFQGCDRLSDPLVVSVTGTGCNFVISGLEDPIAETMQVGIELFPNPTYGPATLRFHESWAGLQKSVMVYDLAGRLVASLQTNDDQTELNLDAAAGFYMVTVQAENGQRAQAALILDARR